MRILILQLSDIHLINGANPILDRVERIGTALRVIEPQPEACVIVLSGDVAYSGESDEYLIAIDFVNRLRERLPTVLGNTCRVGLVTVPGNHDCDFKSGLAARDIIVESIAASPKVVLDSSIVSACTQVQTNYFLFRDLVTDGVDRVQLERDQLYEEYEFSVGETRVLFRCVNSAWLCRRNSAPGTLYFPSELIPDRRADVALHVIVMHHPYNWFNPINSRQLRDRLQEVSDVIFTGHEHVGDSREVRAESGESNLYVEGGVLQQTGEPSTSEFTALLVEPENQRQKLYRFAWDEDMYVATREPEDWDALQSSRLRETGTFAFSEDFATFLEDPGLALGTRDTPTIRLSDVFCYPDVRRAETGTEYAYINSRRVIVEDPVTPNTLLTGADLCGKTALAKRLMSELRDVGFVPILLRGNASTKFSNEASIRRGVETAFREQYRGDEFKRYQQLDPTSKVLIVDDFDAIRTSAGFRHEEFISELVKSASRVILLGNDIKYQIEQVIDAGRMVEARDDFTHYRIQQFGWKKRAELVERWAVNVSPKRDGEETVRSVISTMATLDTVIGKNFVPSFPVFLLAIIQAQQANEQVDTTESKQGYFYELFIRNTLARGSTTIQFNVKVTFLAELAHDLWQRDMHTFDEDRFRAVHDEYRSKYLIHVSFIELETELLRCQILEKRGDSYLFKYPYIYYYFVASYCRDHLDRDDIRAAIVTMSSDLANEDNANVLLFLAHLSKDPFIINQMLRQADAHFADTPVVRFDHDVPGANALDGLIQSALKAVFEDDGRYEEYRKNLYERIDAVDERADDAAREHSTPVLASGTTSGYREPIDPVEEAIKQDVTEYVGSVGAAFKTLQILGQILKNFGGSIEADVKTTVTAAAYGLGLRTLGSFFEIIRTNRTYLVDGFVGMIREEEKGLTDSELADKAKASISALVYMTSYATIKRISHAVGDPALMPAFDVVKDADDSPAVALIHTSLQLDQAKQFPMKGVGNLVSKFQSNTLAMSLLRSLVNQHMHLFPMDYDKKQQACELVGISYKRVQRANPRGRLISPAKV